jgi:hypothetical protein
MALGDGRGNFLQPTQTTVTVFGSYFFGFAAADFSGDGKTDLLGLLADPSGAPAWDLDLLVSTGTGFGAPQRIRSGPFGQHLSNASTPVSVADLNGDGKPDVVLSVTAPTGRPAVEGILINPSPQGVWQ